jgi:hypothetical protein
MTLRTVLLSGLVASALGGTVLVVARPSPALAFQSGGDQAAVARSFRSVLGWDPHPYEIDRGRDSGCPAPRTDPSVQN